MSDSKPSVFTSISQYLSAAKLTEKNRTFQSKPVKSIGKQLYTLKDLAGIVNPIAALLRLICIHYKVSEIEFNEMHHQLKREMGKTSDQINQDIGNLRKNLRSPRLTVAKLEEAVAVLGYDIVDISVTLHNKKTGTLDTFHSSSVSDLQIPTSYDDLAEDNDNPLISNDD